MLIPDRLRQVRELKDDSWATRWLAMGHSGPTVSMWAHRAEKVSLRRLWQQQQQQQEEETAAAAAAAAGAVSGMGGGGQGGMQLHTPAAVLTSVTPKAHCIVGS